MENIPLNISELSALATILVSFLLLGWKGIPALIAHLKEKDTTHRDDIMTLLESAKAERETFYERHGIGFEKLNHRLDKIESAIRTTAKLYDIKTPPPQPPPPQP